MAIFSDENDLYTTSSEEMFIQVKRARDIQLKRFEKSNIRTNSQMETAHIKEFCAISKASETLLQRAYERFSFSARAYNSLIKVARTSADLRDSPIIMEEDICGALMARD